MYTARQQLIINYLLPKLLKN